nr:hypothetical protein [Tanacetum cinerariifolium]
MKMEILLEPSSNKLMVANEAIILTTSPQQAIPQQAKSAESMEIRLVYPKIGRKDDGMRMCSRDKEFLQKSIKWSRRPIMYELDYMLSKLEKECIIEEGVHYLEEKSRTRYGFRRAIMAELSSDGHSSPSLLL